MADRLAAIRIWSTSRRFGTSRPIERSSSSLKRCEVPPPNCVQFDNGFPLGSASPSFPFLTPLPPVSAPLRVPARSPWIVPGILLGISLGALLLASALPAWAPLSYFVPFTFLGNSLAPLPYDGAVVYLGARYPLWMMARDGTRAFRNHRVTLWSLRWYRKAPFCSLVLTCVLPIVPHYPMRILAVLAAYPLWKYQLSVILGRGTRYAGLVLVGATIPIPGLWIVLTSLVILALGARGARRMNRAQPEPTIARSLEAALREEA